MRSQLLLWLSFVLTLYGQIAALSSPETTLHRREFWITDASVARPWPIQGKSHLIRYCFESFTGGSQSQTMEYLQTGIQRWRKGMTDFEVPIKYKYLKRCPDSGDFVKISTIDGDEVFTTLGYLPGREHTMEIGREFLKLDTEAIVVRLTHELGRNMGLPNIHQMVYPLPWPKFLVICKNIQGYKMIVERHGEAMALRACESVEVATAIGWREGMQLAIYDESQYFSPNEFTQYSIMNLGSKTFGRKRSLLGIPVGKATVLYRINHHARKYKVPFDSYKEGPSNFDMNTLKSFYTGQTAR